MNGLFSIDSLIMQFAHVFPFHFHGGMDITVQCNVDVGMTEDFTEAFDLETQLDTSGGKGVSQCMEICVRYVAVPKIFFESVLDRSRLQIFYGGSGEKIIILTALKHPQHINDLFRQRDVTDR